MCCKESESEERLRQQVDSMQLTVTSASDVETDASDYTEQIAALHSEVVLMFIYWSSRQHISVYAIIKCAYSADVVNVGRVEDTAAVNSLQVVLM